MLKWQEIETEIEQLQETHKTEKEQLVQATTTPVQTGPHPDFQVWIEDNAWYNNDDELREFADATGFIFMNKNQGIAPEKVLEHVEKKVRKQFPEKFGVKRAAPNAVQGVDRQNKAGKKVDTDIPLDEMEVSIMKTFGTPNSRIVKWTVV